MITLNSLNFCTSEFSSKSSNLVQPSPQPQTLVIGATDYREQHVSSGVVQENAVAYVAGYLLKKCFNIHDCSTCKETLESANLDNSSKLFCYFKNYKEDNSSGGLHMPPQCFLDYILRLEDSFVKNFSVYTKSTTVG
ncbi:Hypothetical predicted protein, partial [Paramuricea clavata]